MLLAPKILKDIARIMLAFHYCTDSCYSKFKKPTSLQQVIKLALPLWRQKVRQFLLAMAMKSDPKMSKACRPWVN